jgi:hypothetical protein
VAETVRTRPGQPKRRTAVRKPFSASTSYVTMKDRQAETEGGNVAKAAAPRTTAQAAGTYPSSSSSPSYAAQKTNASAQSAQRSGPSQGGDTWDGWARRYVPGQRDMLFNNPDIIVRDWLSQGKYKDNPQMAGDLSRYANIVFGGGDRPGLYELMTAGSLNPKATGDDDMINYLVQLMGEQSKVGGKSPSIEQMLNLLYEGLNDPDSVMGSMLTGGTSGTTGEPANTQAAINAVLSYIPLLGEFSGNQRYADAMYRQAANVAQDYQDLAVKGKNKQSFSDFFQGQYLGGR